jgi:hypothetical protein
MDADQLFEEMVSRVHRFDFGRDDHLVSIVWDDVRAGVRRFVVGKTLTEALSKALAIIDPTVDQS